MIDIQPDSNQGLSVLRIFGFISALIIAVGGGSWLARNGNWGLGVTVLVGFGILAAASYAKLMR